MYHSKGAYQLGYLTEEEVLGWMLAQGNLERGNDYYPDGNPSSNPHTQCPTGAPEGEPAV
jgi:hypothetical protein